MKRHRIALIVLTIGLIGLIWAGWQKQWFSGDAVSPQPKPPVQSPQPPAPLPVPEKPPTAPPTPTVEPDISPIDVEGQGGLGCSDPVSIDRVVLSKVEAGLPDSSEKPLQLRESNGETYKYYLDLSGVAPNGQARMAQLLTEGQNLRIRYVLCGSGGFRFLTRIEPLPPAK